MTEDWRPPPSPFKEGDVVEIECSECGRDLSVRFEKLDVMTHLKDFPRKCCLPTFRRAVLPEDYEEMFE